MHVVVTGHDGQIARALLAASVGASNLKVTPLGRQQVDLRHSETALGEAFATARPDIIVNAAAFTQVDLAERESESCFAVNRDGAGKVARIAARLGVPIVQISTDYVFDGSLATPYRESDPPNPINVYGHSKHQGEQEVERATDNYAVLRTSWVFAPDGQNFVKTMLRLAESSKSVKVVADQIGSPTYAADIAQGILSVARNLLIRPKDPLLRGVFHMTAAGETSWAGFAQAIFADLAARRGTAVEVVPIPSSEYPTLAKRPSNSRLDCQKLSEVHNVRLPCWTLGLACCLDARYASQPG